ncbi:hypothetical protein D9M72_585230 [compost metagenome]
MDRNGECQPQIHARGIELNLGVNELADLRKLNDVVEAVVDLLLGHPQDGAVQVDVVTAGKIGVKSRTHFDEAGYAAPGPYRTGVRKHDPGNVFQQSGFA